MITSFAKYTLTGYLTSTEERRGSVYVVKGEQVEFADAFFVPTTVGMDRSFVGDMERWDFDVYIPGKVTQDLYGFDVPAGEIQSPEQTFVWTVSPGRHFKSPTGAIDYTIYACSFRKN